MDRSCLRQEVPVVRDPVYDSIYVFLLTTAFKHCSLSTNATQVAWKVHRKPEGWVASLPVPQYRQKKVPPWRPVTGSGWVLLALHFHHPTLGSNLKVLELSINPLCQALSLTGGDPGNRALCGCQ
eukprot:787290-Pelagomonas_calceolata.AAC.8